MSEHFDLVVIGGGPAGQKAAVQASKLKKRVLLVDRAARAGGECVRRGTIPSKTLRETAIAMSQLGPKSGGVLTPDLVASTRLESLMSRKDAVVDAHERFMEEQLRRNGIARRQGLARFVSPTVLHIQGVRAEVTEVTGGHFVLATGSRPRKPPEVDVDHDHILDSDSILSLAYLPESLAVLGSGVIATEYASIFAALGVRVTMVDASDRPLRFLDEEITRRFVRVFEHQGGRFLGGQKVTRCEFDGVSSVLTTLADGTVIETEKALCALGRVAAIDGLGLDAAGVKVSPRSLVEVDASFRTNVPHIYAIGDVIGPPSLAATSMEQGRRAVCAMYDVPTGDGAATTPVGVYAIPEMAEVGLTEAAARAEGRDVVVGRSALSEVARGHIAASEDGLVKLVVDAATGKVIGSQVLAEGASELVHVAQMAMIGGLGWEAFVDHVFNFPTLAEAYRVAALDVMGQLRARERAKRLSMLPGAPAPTATGVAPDAE